MIAAFLTELLVVAHADASIVLITADSGPAEVHQFRATFPERFVDVGIAEANAVSLATGLALEGYKPVVVALARYLVGRAFDQIRQGLGIMNAPVTLIGAGSGLSLGAMGPTHHCLDDVALIRSIPNVDIQAASGDGSAIRMAQLLSLAVPRYIRLESRGMEASADYVTATRGKWLELVPGRDATILAVGAVVDLALQARGALAAIGIEVGVVDAASLRPVDLQMLCRCAAIGPLVTIEEHGLGGLGTLVLEHLHQVRAPASLTCLRVEADTSSNSHAQLRVRAGLTTERVVQQHFMLLGERKTMTTPAVTQSVNKFDDVFNLYLLTACDMKCSFCYASKDLGAMPIDRVRGILDYLRQAGASRINLTGGEILMYRYAYEAVEYAHRIGFKVTMFTSGAMLNPERIERFAPHIDWLALSLDGDAEVNVEMGRSERHFGGATSALTTIRTISPNVKVRVATVVTTVNVRRLHSLGEVLAAPETKPDLWRLKQMVPTRAGRDNYDTLGTDAQVFADEMARLVDAFGSKVNMQVTPMSSKVADTMCIHPDGMSTITIENDEGMVIHPLGNFFGDPDEVLRNWNEQKDTHNSARYGTMWLVPRH